jgi:hypothetical protein
MIDTECVCACVCVSVCVCVSERERYIYIIYVSASFTQHGALHNIFLHQSFEHHL